MAKQLAKQAVSKSTGRKLTSNATALVLNELFTLRQDMINKLLNPTRDLNYACGYPDSISTSDYQALYESGCVRLG